MKLHHAWGALKALAVTVLVLPLSLAFPALAMAQSEPAETFSIIETILSVVPDWVQVLTLFSAAFSALAAVTPTVRDDEWSSGLKQFLAKLRRLLDALGMSLGNANKQGKK